MNPAITNPAAFGPQPDDASPRNAAELLPLVRHAFADAAARDVDRFRLRHAARTFRCEVAGPALPSLVRAAFAATMPTPPADDGASFVIRAWDTTSCSVPFPRVTWPDDAVMTNGTVRDWNTADASFRIQQLERVFTVVDHPSHTAYVWTPDAAQLDYAERCRPFSNALHAGLMTGGHCLAHAAGVEVGGRGLVLAGASGSGKSTLAVAAMLHGMPFAGDDRVIVGMRDGRPWMEPAYATASLDARAVEMVPGVERFEVGLGNGVHHKRAFHLGDDRMCSGAPVAAIVCPEIGGGAPSIVPMPSPQCLLRLAPSSVFIPVGGGAAELKILAEVARTARCFRFTLGGDPLRAAACLEAWARDQP